MKRSAGQKDWIGIRWGVPCSAVFHLAIVLLALFVLPEPRKPKALPKEIPVEVVRKAPEKKPAKKPPAQTRKSPPKSDRTTAKKPKIPLVSAAKDKKESTERKQPAAKKAETEKPTKRDKPPQPAEKKPPAKLTEAPRAPSVRENEPKTPTVKPSLGAEAKKPIDDLALGAKKPQPRLAPDPPLTAKEPQVALGPRPPSLLRPKPAPPPKPKSGTLKVPPHAGAVPSPNAKKRNLLGQWVLTPITLDTGHKCGRQRVTGTMDLVKRRVRRGGAEIQYLAEIRTTVYWERCRPEGTLTKLALIRRGDKVILLGAQGPMDFGVLEGNMMMLRDSLGYSYWHLRK